MSCDTTYLDCRIQGSLLPDTRVTFVDDDATVDISLYSGWQVQASSGRSLAAAWTKTAGISVVGSEVVIGWLSADLGTLTPGEWVLELSGTLVGKQRKASMRITIDPEVV